MYIRKKKLKENQVPIAFSMRLCMIFCKINIQGSWGDVNKVLNKCPNDELYICEDLVNVLHEKCTDACCMDA